MNAWVCRRYGGPDVLERVRLPRPVPADDEVLVRIEATSVSSADARVRALRLPRGFGPLGRLFLGFTGPRTPVLGTEFAGVIESVGTAVTSFRPGDAMFGFPGGKMGCHAEYRTMPATGALAPKPASLTFAEAAGLCFGGTTALHFLRKAGLKRGESILVLGSSGAVGVALVQLARHLGARVTGVTSTVNVELVRSLGAARVLDYTRKDFRRDETRYDVIADTVGSSHFAECLPLLNEHGRYLGIAADLLGLLARPKGNRRSIAGPAEERPEDVRELARLAEAGIVRPVIDSTFAFEHLREAHARVDTGRKRGSVIVTLAPGSL